MDIEKIFKELEKEDVSNYEFIQKLKSLYKLQTNSLINPILLREYLSLPIQNATIKFYENQLLSLIRLSEKKARQRGSRTIEPKDIIG